MKIHNKKKFVSGICFLLLGVFNIVTMIVRKNIDIELIILAILSFLISVNQIADSFSRKKPIDERARLVELTVDSKVLGILSKIVIVCIVIGGIASIITKNMEYAIAVIPFIILLHLYFFIGFILSIYYDKKMKNQRVQSDTTDGFFSAKPDK